MKLNKKAKLALLTTGLVGLVAVPTTIALTSCSKSNSPKKPTWQPDELYKTKDGKFDVINNKIVYFYYENWDDSWKNLVIPSEVELENGAKMEIHEIGYTVFYYDEATNPDKKGKQIESVTIPNTITKIGDGAFYGNNIKELVIPDSVKEIGVSCFENNQISSLTIGSGLETIPRNCFSNNKISNLKSLKNVKVVEYAAFSRNEWTNLEFLKNSKVEVISQSAFTNHTNFENVKLIVLPPNLKSAARFSFSCAQDTIVAELRQPVPDLEKYIDLNGVDLNNVQYVPDSSNLPAPTNTSEWVKVLTGCDGY